MSGSTVYLDDKSKTRLFVEESVQTIHEALNDAVMRPGAKSALLLNLRHKGGPIAVWAGRIIYAEETR